MRVILSPDAGFLVASPRGLSKDSSIRVLLAVSFQKRKPHFLVNCIKEDSEKKQRSRGKSKPEETSTGPLLSGAETSGLSRQGEILALLRRIQLSISDKESVQREKGRGRKSDKSQTAKPVAEFHGGQGSAKKKTRAGRTSRDQKLSDSREGYTLKISQRSEDPPPHSDSKPFRSPSSFFRQSPIPAPSPPRVIGAAATTQLTKEETVEKTPVVGDLDGFKLSELKNLAKSRGIRGYSKLNKAQLIDLLNSQVNPA